MARTTVSNISFTISGSTEPVIYFDEDMIALTGQATAIGSQPVYVKVNVPIELLESTIPAGQVVTGMIAVDVSGHQLNGQQHLIVLPCPPYCEKGKGGALG